jgi:predicted O-methyltransferase YrrM
MGWVSKLPLPLQQPVGQAASKTVLLLRTAQWMIRPPSGARDLEPSSLVPAAQELCPNDPDLIRYALDLARAADGTQVQSSSRMNASQRADVERWPGQHYRLLKALVADLKPKLVVEIGTFTGLSALAMLEALPKGSRLITYDILPWSGFPDTVLRDEDFQRGLEQRLGDLSDPRYFASQQEEMLTADLLFMDAPKNARFEPAFFSLFESIRQKPGLMVWDDIRMLGMIEMWRTLERPKADLTSLGHWTGTGLLRVGR